MIPGGGGGPYGGIGGRKEKRVRMFLAGSKEYKGSPEEG